MAAEAGEIKVFIGWKRIEEHLGLSRPTVISNGFPVRRGQKGGVFAFSDELEAHRRNMPLRTAVNLERK